MDDLLARHVAARVARGRTPSAGPGSTRPATTSCGGPASRAASGWSPSCAQRLREPALARGAVGVATSAWADEVLDPEALTIGFARRFATYKRATLLLSQPERLKAPAAVARPAGAVRVRRQGPPGRRHRQGDDPPDRRSSPPTPSVRHRFVFVDDYDIAVARALLPGRRRVAQQPPPAAGGVRHVGHEGGAQRRPQLLDPRRLVGRDASTARTAGPSPRPRRSTTSSRRDELEAESACSSCSSARSCPLFYERAAGPGAPPAGSQRVKRSLRTLGPAGDAPPHGARLRRASCTSPTAARADALGADGYAPGPGPGGVEGAGARRRGTACTSTTSTPTTTVADLGADRDGRGRRWRWATWRPTTSRCSCSTARSGQGDELRRPARSSPMTPAGAADDGHAPLRGHASPASRPAATASPCGSSPATPTSSPPSSSASSPGPAASTVLSVISRRAHAEIAAAASAARERGLAGAVLEERARRRSGVLGARTPRRTGRCSRARPSASVPSQALVDRPLGEALGHHGARGQLGRQRQRPVVQLVGGHHLGRPARCAAPRRRPPGGR